MIVSSNERKAYEAAQPQHHMAIEKVFFTTRTLGHLPAKYYGCCTFH